jgi:hypothetical protein
LALVCYAIFIKISREEHTEAMLNKITCITALLVAISWNMASAVVSGGSNLDNFDYPSHSCSKPLRSSRVFKPHSFANSAEVEQYNAEVRNYNAKFEKYAECIKKYIDNANRDMERIREKATEAIAEAEK